MLLTRPPTRLRSLREPDYRATRLESLKLLEGRRSSYDVAMWQAPTLTVLAQTFLLTILSDPSVRFGVALGALLAGWSTLFVAGVALAQMRDRELHFSQRINVLAGSVGMERPTRRRAQRRRRQWLLERKPWRLWYGAFGVFGLADLVALVWTHCRL